jgi:hypothetical protein
MTDAELDAVYTRLCHTLTELGPQQATLFLARFALLALDRLGDSTAALALIEAAAQGLPEAERPPERRQAPA